MDVNQSKDLSQRRQQALDQLRNNLGASREEGQPVEKGHIHQALDVLRQMTRQARSQENTASSQDEEEVDEETYEETYEEVHEETGEGSAANLSAEGSITETIRQLVQQMQGQPPLPKRSDGQENGDAIDVPPELERFQIKQLYSPEFIKFFLEDMRLFLSNPTGPEEEPPSTSVEELESYQKQVKLRSKVLEVLLNETEEELVYLELRIRALRTLSDGTQGM